MHAFLPPEWHDTLPSTNSELAARVRSGSGVPSGTVVAARSQTAGRGRQNRVWVAGEGGNLTFSFLLRTPAVFPRLASLPMAVALAVAEQLEGMGLLVQTKWPNDLLVGERKICGILSECITSDTGEGSVVVVGVGLNVNMTEDEARLIEQSATSIRIGTGHVWEVEPLLLEILPRIGVWIAAWEGEGFAALSEAWTARCRRLGTWVTVRDGGRMVSGRLEGFGASGEIRLRLDTGETRSVWSGDVDGTHSPPPPPA